MTTPRLDSHPIGDLPGIRTFRSERFRIVVAGGLALAGVVLSVVFFAALWSGDPPWLYDFTAYYHAAERMLEGASPYFDEQFDGPVDAVCDDCYLYPPMLAQLLAPLTVLPLPLAKAAWFVIATAAGLASTWLATGIGGAPRSLERSLWCIVATAFFVPIFHANYYGNVGSFVALAATMVALGGVAGGVAAALATLLKMTPLAWGPAMLAAGRSSRWAFAFTLVVVAGGGFALAPNAWLDYPAVFVNLIGGSTDYIWNLALHNAAARSGWSELAVTLVRLAAVAGGIAAVAMSFWLARRPGGLPAASIAGGAAMLLIPGTLWAHYFAVLLPFAAMAWPMAKPIARLALFASAATVVAFGFGETYVVPHIGAAMMVLAAGWVLWPRVQEDSVHGRSTSETTGATSAAA